MLFLPFAHKLALLVHCLGHNKVVIPDFAHVLEDLAQELNQLLLLGFVDQGDVVDDNDIVETLLKGQLVSLLDVGKVDILLTFGKVVQIESGHGAGG